MRVRLARIREAAAFRPAGYYEDVVGSGQVAGAWVILDGEVYRELRSKYQAFGPGVRLRTAEEQAAALAICHECAELTGEGRCRVCRTCGGTRRVADYVRLHTHRCPEGKW